MPSSHGSPAFLILVNGDAPVPAVGTGDQNFVGVTFGDAGGDRADSHFGDKLYTDGGTRISILQVEDQLREIFDRVNVVVRRRADQTNARRRMTRRGDDLVDLVTRKFSAFARLRSLSDFDLQLVGVSQVPACDAEPSRRDLLNVGPFRVFIRATLCRFLVELLQTVNDRFVIFGECFVWNEALVIFSAFAGVTLSSHDVHGDGQSLVSFG